MIGFLQGTVDTQDGAHVLLNVHGVGYRVLVSKEIRAGLEIGKEVKLYTYTYVREDALELFGFLALEDLKLFEHLISVSGVGPKTAINIFSIGSRSQILSAIISDDVSFFSAVPRLGKKNAQKIIIELKSKFSSSKDLEISSLDGVATDEVVQALLSIGFTKQEAHGALRQIKGEGKTVEEKIKLALKYLGR
ncbi:MAG TPA: Holliday junction branch migration protein RuvA [Candidatus Saccharimonadales bacterium]|nr:Holliday junction branch migration protein RuvA [Candidatus Saccharimonadales bacterium]